MDNQHIQVFKEGSKAHPSGLVCVWQLDAQGQKITANPTEYTLDAWHALQQSQQ